MSWQTLRNILPSNPFNPTSGNELQCVQPKPAPPPPQDLITQLYQRIAVLEIELAHAKDARSEAHRANNYLLDNLASLRNPAAQEIATLKESLNAVKEQNFKLNLKLMSRKEQWRRKTLRTELLLGASSPRQVREGVSAVAAPTSKGELGNLLDVEDGSQTLCPTPSLSLDDATPVSKRVSVPNGQKQIAKPQDPHATRSATAAKPYPSYTQLFDKPQPSEPKAPATITENVGLGIEVKAATDKWQHDRFDPGHARDDSVRREDPQPRFAFDQAAQGAFALQGSRWAPPPNPRSGFRGPVFQVSPTKLQAVSSYDTSFSSTASFRNSLNSRDEHGYRTGQDELVSDPQASRTEDPLLPAFFRHGISYTPSPSEKNTRRTVIIDNLPVGITLSEVLDHVHSGALFSADLLDTSAISASMTVMLVFVYQNCARGFAAVAKAKPLVFSERTAGVTHLSSHTWPVPVWLQRPIFVNGYTRCIVVRDIPGHVTPFVLEAKLRLHQEIEQHWVQSVQRLPDGSMEVVFENIRAAVRAFAFLTCHAMFRSCRISFARDPCDRAAKVVEEEKKQGEGVTVGADAAETVLEAKQSSAALEEGEILESEEDSADEPINASTRVDGSHSNQSTSHSKPPTPATTPIPDGTVVIETEKTALTNPTPPPTPKPDPFAALHNPARLARASGGLLAQQFTASTHPPSSPLATPSSPPSLPSQNSNEHGNEHPAEHSIKQEAHTRPTHPPTPTRSDKGAESPKQMTMQRLAAEMEEMNLREAYGEVDCGDENEEARDVGRRMRTVEEVARECYQGSEGAGGE
ncbi:hypothetical protein H2199_003316 [Coniosporium tulheliwenetii]|uniref:Uncharacterized protein n=1 Tax=Coniosporium tulheliwenetii TaxID=3383036 RepID=A0ACC2ZDD3_9PEZI|nr:hypothetical protein H2199_003316 [Cladosporium sp. JES 115]